MDKTIFGLPIDSVTVFIYYGTDKITFNIKNIQTAFPDLEYPVSLTMEARKGYGEQWVKEVLGITPEVITVPQNHPSMDHISK